jgi:hypothetical protein
MSNIAEALNSWLLEAREKPILAMFEHIWHQLMGWYTERCTLEDKTLVDSPKELEILTEVLDGV